MNSSIACSIRSIKYSYGTQTVLDIPKLDIQSGQICVLTGPNGCGKSTLLSILALLVQPQTGRLLLYGMEASGAHIARLRKKVTLVHQKPVLFSTTVQSNIAYGLHAAGLSSKEIRSRVEYFLQKSNLTGIADKHARKLSGGEGQRVALTRGFVLETPLILLDEPTNSLDDASRPLLYEMLAEAKARGTTIVIASHDPEMVSSFNPQILRLDRGKIV